MDERNREQKRLAYTIDQLKLLASHTDAGTPYHRLDRAFSSAINCFENGDGRQGVQAMFTGLGIYSWRARGSYTIHAETRRPLAIKMNDMKATVVLDNKKRVCVWDFEEHSSYPEMAKFFSFILDLSRKPMPTSKLHRPKGTDQQATRLPSRLRQAKRLPSRLRQSTSAADINQENEIHEPDETSERPRRDRSNAIIIDDIPPICG